ncbi:MAG: hypothetical protein K8I00_01260 [Candidatus Omnitrophica bacterium]|nr:hypothetical protein [Candidatus Omnitrophota bacterium]
MNTTPKIWVEITLEKNDEDFTSVRGLISASALDKILANTYDGFFFRMDKVHWVSEEDDDVTNKPFLKYYIYGQNADLVGLNGTSYYRTSDIREVSPLVSNYDKIFENAKFEEAMFNF